MVDIVMNNHYSVYAEKPGPLVLYAWGFALFKPRILLLKTVHKNAQRHDSCGSVPFVILSVFLEYFTVIIDTSFVFKISLQKIIIS